MTGSSSDVLSNRRDDRLHGEGGSGGLEGVQIDFSWRGSRIEQEGDPVDARRNLLEQLQPLSGHRLLHCDETGDVAAWARNARDEAAPDRIGDLNENNRDAARLLQQRHSVGCALRNNEVGLQRDELLRGSLPRLPRRAPSGGRSGCCGPPSSRAVGAVPETPQSWPELPGRSRQPASAWRSAAPGLFAAHAPRTATPPRRQRQQEIGAASSSMPRVRIG